MQYFCLDECIKGTQTLLAPITTVDLFDRVTNDRSIKDYAGHDWRDLGLDRRS